MKNEEYFDPFDEGSACAKVANLGAAIEKTAEGVRISLCIPGTIISVSGRSSTAEQAAEHTLILVDWVQKTMEEGR